MAAKTTERRRLSARVAITTRHHPDDPGLPALRAELAAARLEEFVRRELDSAPPLSRAQRDKIAALFSGAGHGS
jgi:hypothetical protein